MKFLSAKSGEEVSAEQTEISLILAADLNVSKQWNGRQFPHTDEEIDELVRKIKNSPAGQESPIHVIMRDEKLFVVNGFGRLEAIKRLNKGKKVEDQVKVKCIVFPPDMTEAQIFVSNIQDNKGKPTSVIDDAHNIERCAGFPEYQKRDGENNIILKDGNAVPDYDLIAKEVYGKTIGWLRQVLSLRTLPEATQKKVHDGKMKFDAALELVTEAKNAEKLKEIEADAEKRAEKRHATKQASDKVKAATAAAKGKKPAGKAASTKAAKGKSSDKPVVTRADVAAAKRERAPQKSTALTLPEIKRICTDALENEVGGSKTKSLPFLAFLQLSRGKLKANRPDYDRRHSCKGCLSSG